MAYSDPLLSGPAVYLARVMLDINPDDGAAGSGKTDQDEEINNQQPITNNYQLYPNPNDGTMTLEYSLGKEETGIFCLYDLQGRRLFSYLLKPETNMMEINEHELQGGVYFYNIIINNSVVKNDKLVIIK